MWKLATVLSSLVLVGSAMAWQQDPAKPADSAAQDAASGAGAAKAPEEAVKMVNPVKATQAGLAHAKKIFGYNCAMCPGTTGNGQGDLAAVKDWRDPCR